MLKNGMFFVIIRDTRVVKHCFMVLSSDTEGRIILAKLLLSGFLDVEAGWDEDCCGYVNWC